MGRKIVHVEFPAQDADRGQKFWEGFGEWSLSVPEGMGEFDYRMFQDDGWGGAVYPSQEGEKGPIIYFSGEDIDADIAKVRELGGRPTTSSRSRTSAGSHVARTPKAIRSASSRRTNRSRRANTSLRFARARGLARSALAIGWRPWVGSFVFGLVGGAAKPRRWLARGPTAGTG